MVGIRAVAVALANLRYLTRHQKKLLKNATELGDRTRLSQMRFKGRATVRGKGFAIGIEVEDEDYAYPSGPRVRVRFN